MNLYRMRDATELHQLAAPKVTIDTEDRYDVQPLTIGDWPALLISGESEVEPVDWAHVVSGLTGVSLDFTSSAASAALFIRIAGTTYALSFGQGWRYLRENMVDRSFGLDVAARLLDPDDIRKVTRWALSAKTRVDQNNVPSGQGLWAFGLREHAEVVRCLTGRALDATAIDLTYVRRRGSYRNFRLTIECGDGVKLQLGTDPECLVADLVELTRLVRDRAVHTRLEPLRWVRRLAQGDPMIELLDSTAADLLADPTRSDGEVGIAYPARYYEGPDVQRYVGHIGETPLDTDELTIDDLREAVQRHGRADYLGALHHSAIQGLDDDGKPLGNEESALNWLAVEVVDPDYRFVLLDGEWHELGEKYIDHVEHVVKEAFKNTPPWTLQPWSSAPLNSDGVVVEREYNLHAADKDKRFLCLDRKLVKTRVHPRGFEACDLLGPNNELVHVKKVSSNTGSSVLSHLFAQGLVAIESLTDRQTWNEFVSLVADQDPQRAAQLGNRPAALVYAIHRSDKALTPETLFTFARSALVSASVSLATFGIPLQIYVIP
jgi:uncharacterized protein (TIGR04141 family)